MQNVMQLSMLSRMMNWVGEGGGGRPVISGEFEPVRQELLFKFPDQEQRLLVK